MPDPGGHRRPLRLEQPVQVADRDVVRRGDEAGSQVGVAQVLLDERVNAQQQRLLPRLGGQRSGLAACSAMVVVTRLMTTVDNLAALDGG